MFLYYYLNITRISLCESMLSLSTHFITSESLILVRKHYQVFSKKERRHNGEKERRHNGEKERKGILTVSLTTREGVALWLQRSKHTSIPEFPHPTTNTLFPLNSAPLLYRLVCFMVPLNSPIPSI